MTHTGVEPETEPVACVAAGHDLLLGGTDPAVPSKGAELDGALTLPFEVPPHLSACEKVDSDVSPALADSLLSLDFDSADPSPLLDESSSLGESGSLTASGSMFASGSLGAPSPPSTSLFAPGPETPAPEPAPAPAPSKRARMETMQPDMLNETLAGPAATDFVLFPDDDHPAPERGSVAAGSASAPDSVLALLESLNQSAPEPAESTAKPLSAAPSDLFAVPAPAPPACAPATVPAQPARQTRRRRRDADELLPIDAPVQPRTYYTDSATSRKDTRQPRTPGAAASPSVTPSPALSATTEPGKGEEMDARSLKRLHNTIAARRSRHRKAEELRQLHNTIEQLQSEVALWKQRCENAERECDQLRSGAGAATLFP